MKLRFFIVLILFAIYLPLYGQTTDQEWYYDKPIADISFSGLKTVNINELRPIVRPYIGKPFTIETFWEIQSRLLELDYFVDITGDAVEGDPEKKSVIVIFKLTERPTIAEIRVMGQSKVSKSSILDKVLMKKGDFINKSSLAVDEENIRQLYIEKGFPNIEVSGKLDIDEQSNTGIVTFTVDEGNETKIQSILFQGNIFASANTLKRLMKTKEQGIFQSGAFQESVLEEDKLLIVNYYKKNGYIDAKIVKIEREVDQDVANNKASLVLTVYIDEGKQYSFGGFSFEGNTLYTNDQFKELIDLKPNAILNMEKVEKSYQSIVRLYTDNGYIFNDITREERRDEENNLISFHVKIVEREKAHIENIIIKGNEKTKDFVLFRELPFEEGDIFSVEKIEKGIMNLYSLQYFSSINVLPKQGSANGLMDLIIDVEEDRFIDFKFAASFTSGDFPIAGNISWTDRNFLGEGKTFGAELEASAIRQALKLNFNDNYFFGSNWGGGLNLSVSHNLVQNVYQDISGPTFSDEDIPDPFKTKEEYEQAIEEGLNIPLMSTMDYDLAEIMLGASTTVFMPTMLGKFGYVADLSFNLDYLWYDSDKFRPYSSTVRNNLNNWDIISKLGNTFYWDNRDVFYNPTSGHYLSQYIGLTGGTFFLPGDRDYIKLKTRAEYFHTLFSLPVSENWSFEMILAAHTSLSMVLPTFGNKFNATPLDLLAIDGMNIARGWPYKPNYKSLWESSLELRIPLAKQLLWGTFFFDVVGAWPEIENMGSMEWEDYYFSFGLGLRLTVPGLPLRLYLAQGFNKENGKWQLREGDFNLGALSPKIVLSFTQPGGF